MNEMGAIRQMACSAVRATTWAILAHLTLASLLTHRYDCISGDVLLACGWLPSWFFDRLELFWTCEPPAFFWCWPPGALLSPPLRGLLAPHELGLGSVGFWLLPLLVAFRVRDAVRTISNSGCQSSLRCALWTWGSVLVTAGSVLGTAILLAVLVSRLMPGVLVVSSLQCWLAGDLSADVWERGTAVWALFWGLRTAIGAVLGLLLQKGEGWQVWRAGLWLVAADACFMQIAARVGVGEPREYSSADVVVLRESVWIVLVLGAWLTCASWRGRLRDRAIRR